jgi:hypothetical protein
VITTLITTTGIVLTDMSVREVGTHPSLWLAADIAAGALGLVLSLWIFPSLVNPHVAQLFEKVALRLPARTGSWLQKFLYRGHLKRSA